jgi:hypothetical protein
MFTASNFHFTAVIRSAKAFCSNMLWRNHMSGAQAPAASPSHAKAFTRFWAPSISCNEMEANFVLTASFVSR